MFQRAQLGSPIAGRRRPWWTGAALLLSGWTVQPYLRAQVVGDEAKLPVFGTGSNTAQISTLDGTNGFRIAGSAPLEQLGFGADGLGDLNGDGIDDFVVGAWRASRPFFQSGAATVVFGNTNRGALGSNLLATSVSGPRGGEFPGHEVDLFLGRAAAGVGDFNADGWDDVALGAHGSDYNGPTSGELFVVFGGPGFSTSLALTNLGSNGVRILGASTDDQIGRSIDGLGDFNGDGLDDMVIGTDRAQPNGLESGAAYLVFGLSNPPPALDLDALTGSDGFRIDGVMSYDRLGHSVSAGGDINGDGFADALIGAPGVDGTNGYNSGAAYIVWGGPGPWPPAIQADGFGTNGRVILGAADSDGLGTAVAGGADVNGDGFDDVLVGAPAAASGAGMALAVFGRAGRPMSPLDPVSLTSAEGVRMLGAPGDGAGQSVCLPGSLDGDDLSELVIGAPLAAFQQGAACLVFGSTNLAPASLASLNGTNGVRLMGVEGGDYFGEWIAPAGDLDGDLGSDVIVAAPRADVGGFTDAGAAYVLFGASPAGGVSGTTGGLTGGTTGGLTGGTGADTGATGLTGTSGGTSGGSGSSTGAGTGDTGGSASGGGSGMDGTTGSTGGSTAGSSGSSSTGGSAFGDYDGDGQGDVIALVNDELALILGRDKGESPEPPLVLSITAPRGRVVAVNRVFRSEGAPLTNLTFYVTASERGTVRSVRVDGNGLTGLVTRAGPTVRSRARVVGSGDFNHDGVIDVALARGTVLAAALSDAQGQWSEPTLVDNFRKAEVGRIWGCAATPGQNVLVGSRGAIEVVVTGSTTSRLSGGVVGVRPAGGGFPKCKKKTRAITTQDGQIVCVRKRRQSVEAGDRPLYEGEAGIGLPVGPR